MPALSGIIDPSPERLIAAARLVLATFGLAAIWLDPSQPAVHASATYGTMAAYVGYAAVILAAALLTEPDFRIEVGTHAIDIATFSVLMTLTEGPTSPFFVFFTFALFAATLRWNWQGALVTALVLVPLFVLTGVLQVAEVTGEEELNRRIIRGAYLVVAAGLLAYLGFVRERSRQRIARLADWPAEPEPREDYPPIEAAVGHALKVIDAERALVLWELEGEPFRYGALCSEAGCDLFSDPPRDEAVIADPDLERATFVVLDAAAGLYRRRGPHRVVRRGRPLAPSLIDEYRIERAIVTPIEGEGFSGHLLLIEPRVLGEDLLALARIVAGHISGEIQRHLLRRELLEAAAIRERARLARDMHDGILQTLTAAGLQARLALSETRGEGRSRLQLLEKLMTDQQKQLRAFVEESRHAARHVQLEPEVGQVLADAARQWGCVTELAVEPPTATVPQRIYRELALMIREAAANAARHGGASRLFVRINKKDRVLQVVIQDDGSGLADDPAARRPSRPVPASLSERIEDLGGDLRLASSREGVEIEIEIPLQ